MARRRRRSRSDLKFERDAPVLTALVLDLGDTHQADFGGARDMGAAAGLEIDLIGALPYPLDTEVV